MAHGGRWYVPPTTTGARRRAPSGPIASGRSGRRPGPRPPEGFDAAAFVTRTLARLPYSHAIEVILHAPPDQVPFPPALAELEPVQTGTRLRMRADSLDWVAGLLASAGCAFTVVAPAGPPRRPPQTSLPPRSLLKIL